MSKQIGLIHLEGTIGGIAFYQSGGQHLARIAKGPSQKQIATQPNFIRTRENNSEFGGAAHVGKALRLALSNALHSMADSRIASRLTKLFKEIGAKDTAGIRGQRSILVSRNTSNLVNFEFNQYLSLSSIFNAPFTATHEPGREMAHLNVADFLPSNFIHAPAGASHFKLLHAVGIISDYAFDTTAHDFLPLTSECNGLGIVDSSAVLSLATPATFHSDIDLNTLPALTADATVIQCLGIEFYQRIGATDYLFAQGNCMKVVAAF